MLTERIHGPERGIVVEFVFSENEAGCSLSGSTHTHRSGQPCSDRPGRDPSLIPHAPPPRPARHTVDAAPKFLRRRRLRALLLRSSRGSVFMTGIAPDASSWIGRSNPFAATGVLQYPIGRVTTPQLHGYRDLLPRGRLGPYLVRALPLPDSCEPLLAHSVNDLSVVVARHPYRSR